ncbi:cytochrome P450 71D445-like [Pyrus communis]|uniref:cytochrome P450 71D445-like n=1 Tax=Pyrus communis TaxID=23211 RepID=UPI0035C0588E
MRKMQSKIGKILDSIINDHKVQRSKEFTMGNDKKEEDDFVDMLLNHQESNKLEFNLTTNQMKDVILDIIGGGSETSATTLEWVMSELLRNPGVMERAQAEETRQLRTPSPLIARESRDRCQISGYELPIKSKVIINEWALGRDPESWRVDAESFEPERFLGSSIDFKGFDFEYIPFGSGSRMCPGISLVLR